MGNKNYAGESSLDNLERDYKNLQCKNTEIQVHFLELELVSTTVGMLQQIHTWVRREPERAEFGLRPKCAHSRRACCGLIKIMRSN